jgi:hypothetical protein
MKKLIAETIDIKLLNEYTINCLFNLMDRYYDNVGYKTFTKDLFEKDSIIILRDAFSKEIKGFSTLQVLENVVLNQKIRVLFSGDTIIDKDYWGSSLLAKMWLKYAFKRKNEDPNILFYWFLISKGYKTYKFLPVFFEDFYPNVDGCIDSNYKVILDFFAFFKFKENYDSKEGLIVFGGKKDKLKKGVAEITDKNNLDKHIKFFLQKNPNWQDGDELACITRIDEKNLRSRTNLLLNSK